MNPIIITQGEEVIAHHTTESVLSHYGQMAWSVEKEHPKPGPAIWTQGESSIRLQVMGVVGGWLVVRQADDLLCGIIWSDGTYVANLIVDRDTSESVKGLTLDELNSGKYQVKGSIASSAFDDGSPLGCFLF